MSVIIRLQNLPWSASAVDIRSYFRGLSIPDGGVHIVGGEMGDAFIAFSTDEDARQAMMLDRGRLKDAQIRLLLSSRAEMQKIIENAREANLSILNISQTRLKTPPPPSMHSSVKATNVPPNLQPPIITTSSLTAILSQQPNNQMNPQLNSSASQQQNQHLVINSRKNIQNDNIVDRQRSPSRGRSRKSRSRSRDRYQSSSRSRSRSRGRGSSRRYRDRSRSYSRERSSNRRRSGSYERKNYDRRDRSNDRSSDRQRKLDNGRDTRITSPKETFSETNKNRNAPALSTVIPIWNHQQTNFVQKPNVPNVQLQFEVNANKNNVVTAVPMLQTNSNQIQNFNMQNFSQPPPNMIMNQLNLSQIRNTKPPEISPFIYGQNITMANTNNNLGNEKQFPFQNNLNISPSISTIMAKSFDFGNKNEIENKSSSQTFHQIKPLQRNEYISPKRTKDYDKFESCCIKVENMCPNTSYSDLRKFFPGLNIANTGIKMINDKYGLRIGEAYVRFLRRESKTKALERTGVYFKNKKVIISDVSEEEFDRAIDCFKPKKDKYRKRTDNNYRQSSQEQSDDDNSNKAPVTEKRPPFTTLLIEDLPAFTKEQDIMKMFSSYTLLDIVLIREQEGRKHCVCYVQFHQAEDAEKALKDVSKHKVAYKHVTVLECSNKEFEYAKGKSTIQDDSDEILIIEDENTSQEENPIQPLPTSSSSDKELQQKDETKKIDNDENTASNTKVEAESNENKKPEIPSLFSLNTQPPSDLVIENFRRKPKKQSRFTDLSDDNQIKTNYVLLKNCDFKAQKNDYVKFFSDIDLKPDSVNILYNHRNQPSGDCICQFTSFKDAEDALKKNYCFLGGRVIRIELIPSEIAENRIRDSIPGLLNNISNNNTSAGFQQQQQQQQISTNTFSNMNNMQMNQQMNLDCGITSTFNRNENYNNNDNNNRTMQNCFSLDQMANNSMMIGNMKSNNIEGLPNMNSGDDYNKQTYQGQLRFSDINIIDSPILGNNCLPMGNNNLNMNNISMGNNINNNMNCNTELQSSMNVNDGNIGQPGCVVEMQNVPFLADIDDIRRFFNGFNVINVIRRYNDNGTPTGDARAAFNTPVEAKAAMESKRTKKIFNRSIFLSLV